MSGFDCQTEVTALQRTGFVIKSQRSFLLVWTVAGIAALSKYGLDVFNKIQRTSNMRGEAQEKEWLQHHAFIR
jgi:hypothetical protein